ncbi:MAG: hypothetical protein ACRD32_01790 [Nitrososphaerales archaeon]
MQPIIILGAVVVAAALIGTGFLGNGGNIQLFLQSLGWGEQDLQAPISHAFIDLNLKKIRNDAGTTNTVADDFFDNVIKSCSFHSDQSIASSPQQNQELSPGVIICKLTDERDKAIAEGRILLNGQAEEECPQDAADLENLAENGGYLASEHINIQICQTAFPGDNEVQKVTDVKIVVEGSLSVPPRPPI